MKSERSPPSSEFKTKSNWFLQRFFVFCFFIFLYSFKICLVTNEFLFVLGWLGNVLSLSLSFYIVLEKKKCNIFSFIYFIIESSFLATLKQHLCTKRACVPGVRDRASKRERAFYYQFLLKLLNLKLRFECK